jgi:hypothetical protein
MTNIKTASLAISLAVLASAANAQSVISYSDSQGYGYRMEPLLPYAPPQRGATRVETRASAAAKPASKVDPALIEELRKKRNANTKPKAGADVTASIDKTPDGKKFAKTKVVREKPIVRTSYRVVEHPPIVVQREVSEDQLAEGGAQPHAAPQGAPFARRTIRAEAEITILGPDRMSIRLFRKQDGSDANAKIERPKRSAKAESKTKVR